MNTPNHYPPLTDCLHAPRRGAGISLSRLLACLLLLTCAAVAEPGASLEWDANTEPDIKGYRLYYGPASGNYTRSLDAGNNTTADLPELVAGLTYYFVVTAYNEAGLESPPSNEVVFTIPMPENMQVTYLSRLPSPLPEGSGILCKPEGNLSASGFSFWITVTAPERTAVSVYASCDMKNWEILGSFTNPTGRMIIKEDKPMGSCRYYRMKYAHLDPPQDD